MVAPKSAIVSYFDLNLRAAPLGGSDAAACKPPVLSEVLAAPAIPTIDSNIEVSAGTVKPIEISPSLRIPVSPTSKQDVTKKGVAAPGGALASESATIYPLKPMSLADQLLMYFGIVIGVVFSSFVQQFKSGEVIGLKMSLASLLVACVIALIIIPVVFQKLTVRPDAPFLVRFGLFVQNGVFWQVLTSSIGKTFVG